MLYQQYEKNDTGLNLSASLNYTRSQIIQETLTFCWTVFAVLFTWKTITNWISAEAPMRTWKHDGAYCSLAPSRCQHQRCKRSSVWRTQIMKSLHLLPSPKSLQPFLFSPLILPSTEKPGTNRYYSTSMGLAMYNPVQELIRQRADSHHTVTDWQMNATPSAVGQKSRTRAKSSVVVN